MSPRRCDSAGWPRSLSVVVYGLRVCSTVSMYTSTESCLHLYVYPVSVHPQGREVHICGLGSVLLYLWLWVRTSKIDIATWVIC